MSQSLTTSTPTQASTTMPTFLTLTFDYNDGVVSAIVGFLLIALVVSYMVLCCHVLRLHRHISRLFRRAGTDSSSTSGVANG